MKCKKVKEYLYEYLTNRLDETTYNEVNKHLKACKNCQQKLQELQTTINLLDYAKPMRPSRNFKDKVMGQLEDKVIPFYKRRAYKYVLQGVAAAVIVLAVVTTLKLRPVTEKEPVIRGGDRETVSADECPKAVDLYNKGTRSEDLNTKEKLLKEALLCNCGDNKIKAKIHNNLGDCYENQGRIDDALEGYNAAIKLDPKLPYPYLSLGDYYKKEGNFQKTIGYYEKAIDIMKTDAARGDQIEPELDELIKEVEELKAK